MTDTLDSLEARAPEERERELMAGLPQLIARAQTAPGWARILDGVNAADITSRAALAQLPVTRKSDLKQLQHDALPFGGSAWHSAMTQTCLGSSRRSTNAATGFSRSVLQTETMP